jgi:RNA polymerase sigma-70 factor (ECF subfamily)
MQTEKSEGVALRRSLESVINRSGYRWFRFIVSVLKNEADAEDAMQEAVRRVLARNRSFPSEEQVRMYLGRAIGNTAFEMYNSRKRERLRSAAVQESLVSCDQTCSPDIGMEKKEEARRRQAMLGLLEEGLKQLPSKQKEALRITILESGGRSLREVGMRHAIPYSTLRHRNKQGLRRMRKFLEQAIADKTA